ncbi:hypothetical protein PoB_004678500 [Plakobranchus ocellatus]|uniref:Uncharacterized protein n=1 Tax=Plakobranchus ocellatus TaxID=259542 RepID=A0AAV4BMK5_9GAST|nr:hypothetical protein PoB_004678500 [Plakobranchus ocellatus]
MEVEMKVEVEMEAKMKVEVEMKVEMEVEMKVEVEMEVEIQSTKGDLKLLGSTSGQCAGSGARTHHNRIPADSRADSLTAVPLTP